MSRDTTIYGIIARCTRSIGRINRTTEFLFLNFTSPKTLQFEIHYLCFRLSFDLSEFKLEQKPDPPHIKNLYDVINYITIL